MTKDLMNSIINYTKEKFGRDDIDLKIEKTEDDRIFLVLVVDCEKMDKNSGKFDQSYFDFVTDSKREKPKGFFLDFGKATVMSPIVNKFEKFMNIKIHTWFSYQNYDYLDNIETKIEKAIPKSSHPNIEISFEGSGEDPKIRLSFYNSPAEFMDRIKGKENSFEDYITELNTLTGLDLKQYTLSRTMASKQNYQD